MERQWLAQQPDSGIAAYVVWSPQLGAAESNVPDGTRLIPDPRVRHYWDPDRVLGRGYQPVVGSSVPAWDVWLLFDRDAAWSAAGVPLPAWWEHQLGDLPPERHLDPARFAQKAESLRTGTLR